MSCQRNQAVICQPPQSVHPPKSTNECCSCVSCHKKNKNKSTCERKKRRCNKCYKRDCECDCIEYYPCLRVKCGCISATLEVTAEPEFFTGVGEVITYLYTITNTGTAIINYPVQICDDRLGSQFNQVCIMPGCSQTLTRTYTVGVDDLRVGSLTNKAVAYIQVKRCKWVFTPEAEITITFGSADVSGTISQEVVDRLTVLTTVTISNSTLSSTPAFNVTLDLPFPVGVTSVVPGAAIGSASAPVVNGTLVNITQASIPVGTTYQYEFTYTVGSEGAYQWSGNILTGSFDPNPTNNHVSNTIIVA